MEWNTVEALQGDWTGHEGGKGDLKVNKVIEFFTISPQYKNANVANFVLAMPFKITKGQ